VEGKIAMDIRKVGNATIAAMPPRIDANTADRVRDALADLVADGARYVLCDFSQNSYLSSAGLRVLLATAKTLHGVDGKLVLFGVSEYVQEILEIAGFSHMLPIHADEEEALRAC
jgi:anti-anti-sigma factor